ncbi:Erythronate-4-phosphate dehydrogenase [Thalassocella blandensis]|nr:Erythronate-4-phosphate dehydrogenase [Thalassocella blandensis]
MKIVADENIPFARDLFSPLGDLHLLPGRQMQNQDVLDADVLLVRSVTNVNRELLHGSAVKFVGTCTIGIDHLDTHYLGDNTIAFASAPGCNALAVVQYVLAALATVNRLQENQKAVIIGGGNVGSRVYEYLQYLGLHCVCVDPFLAQDGDMNMGEFGEIYDADIVCMHTPLTIDGAHPTFHMLNEAVLSRLKQNAVLLNAGRGAVIDNNALLKVIEKRQDLTVILDVWEKEPDIHRELLQKVSLGTPHIAGYSFEGRINGSFMIYQALRHFLGHEKQLVQQQIDEVRNKAFGEPLPVCVKSLHAAILNSYLLSEDHKALLAVSSDLPAAFDRLRKYYPQRREFSHFHICNAPQAIAHTLKQLGFRGDE